MKKVILSAFVAGIFMISSVFAQTSAPAQTGKPATKTETTPGGAKTDKASHKGHHKGKGKKSDKSGTSKTETKPADKK